MVGLRIGGVIKISTLVFRLLIYVKRNTRWEDSLNDL